MSNFLNILFCFLIISPLLYSQKKDEFKQEIKIGAVIFTGWEFNIDDAEFISKVDTSQPDANSIFGYKPAKTQFEKSKNSFFLTRSYLNLFASLAPDVKARLTSDVYSFVDGTGKTQFGLQIKYANIYYTPFVCENGLALGLGIGVIANNWISTNDKYWGYRPISKSYTDYDWMISATRNATIISRTTSSFFGSADLGFEAVLNLPKGFGELSFEVLQGNGFRNLSFDTRFKDVMFSAFLHPLANRITKAIERAKKNGKDRVSGITDLTLGGFGYMGKFDKSENTAANGVQYKRNHFGGMAHFRYNFKKSGFVKIGGEFATQSNEDPSSSKPDSLIKTNAGGFSSYLEFCPPIESLQEKISLLFRYDMFDPNTENSLASTTTFNDNSDKQSLLIAGLIFRPNKFLGISATYQSITYEKEFVIKYNGTLTKADSKLFIHSFINF